MGSQGREFEPRIGLCFSFWSYRAPGGGGIGALKIFWFTEAWVPNISLVAVPI